MVGMTFTLYKGEMGLQQVAQAGMFLLPLAPPCSRQKHSVGGTEVVLTMLALYSSSLGLSFLMCEI